MSQIGTLSEKSLHASLKRWYKQPGDLLEVDVDGYVIDIVRRSLLIEIQTRHLYSLKPKLEKLLRDHKVRLVYPLPKEKWIVRQTATGTDIGRRKSPKKGRPVDLFSEIVRIPDFLLHPNLSLELLMTRQEEIWRDDGGGSWRRKRWSMYDRRLLEVIDQTAFRSVQDYAGLLPVELPTPFSNRELASGLDCHIALARKVSYTLRHMGVISLVGKSGNQHLHQLAAS
jgi:hypothetical protein